MGQQIPPVHLTIGLGWYLLQCGLASLVLRAVIFIFRAWAVTRGDFPDSDVEKGRERFQQPGRYWTFWQAFWECFKGFGKHKAHADLWLNFIIGFCEVAAYPVLLRSGFYSIIGGWLLIRAAVAWGGWSISRTSYNRHLLNILLELAVAYFWLQRYIVIVDQVHVSRPLIPW